MNTLRIGRFSLLVGLIGVAVVAATFYASALWVLAGIWAVATVGLGLCGVRTRAGRIGLGLALIALPGTAFLAYRYGFDARTRPVPLPVVATTRVYFSPNGGCTDALIRKIDAAKRSVLVQACWFTSEPIADALVAAHRRGVLVRVVLDKNQEQEKSRSQATYLIYNGVEAVTDAGHSLAHNKVMVIDAATVITGSMNLTPPGENKNAENLLVIDDARLATTYTNNWNAHIAHSRPYMRTAIFATATDDEGDEE